MTGSAARQTIYHSVAVPPSATKDGLYGGWLEAALVLQHGPTCALDVAEAMETAPVRAADILADMARAFCAIRALDGSYRLSTKGLKRMRQAEAAGR